LATDNNTAIGSHALEFNAKAAGNINTPTSNTANGFDALYNNLTGSNNVALGIFAGRNATTGNGNVYIGHSRRVLLAKPIIPISAISTSPL
jgi:hypothetical protein